MKNINHDKEFTAWNDTNAEQLIFGTTLEN
jgi:hypothetical protein